MKFGVQARTKPLRLPALIAFIVACLTSCGGIAGSSAESANASEPAESIATASPPPKSVTLNQLDPSKVRVRGAPDWMAHDGTALFVKTDSGSVAVINPKRGSEVRRYTVATTGLCQGIGIGGGAIWSCDSNQSGNTDDVMRLNPKSGKVERLRVGKRQDQGHLDVAAGRVWVITDAGLVGLNVNTGRPDPAIDLSVPGPDLATTEDRAYVVSRGAGAVVAVDLANRRVVAQANVADARTVTVSDQVWVLTGSELIALDKPGLQEAARIKVDGTPCGVAVEADRVFVRGTERLLTEIDAASHRVIRVVTDAGFECADVHVGFGSVWLSSNEGDVVYRVPL